MSVQWDLNVIGATRYVACYLCGGSGMTCDFCDGEGVMYKCLGTDELYTLEEIFPLQTKEVVCPVCHGTGEILEDADLQQESD